MLLPQALDICQTRTQTALGFAHAGQPALAKEELHNLYHDLANAFAVPLSPLETIEPLCTDLLEHFHSAQPNWIQGQIEQIRDIAHTTIDASPELEMHPKTQDGAPTSG